MDWKIKIVHRQKGKILARATSSSVLKTIHDYYDDDINSDVTSSYKEVKIILYTLIVPFSI